MVIKAPQSLTTVSKIVKILKYYSFCTVSKKFVVMKAPESFKNKNEILDTETPFIFWSIKRGLMVTTTYAIPSIHSMITLILLR